MENNEIFRICPNCNKEFSLGVNPNGCVLRRIYCNSNCKDTALKRRWKKNNPEKVAASRRKRWEATKANPERLKIKRQQDIKACSKVRQWLTDYKMKNGCVDCGYKEHFSALQLDHEGFKNISIAEARSSVKRLEKEIEEGQCVVRCANCHSIITWKRKAGLI